MDGLTSNSVIFCWNSALKNQILQINNYLLKSINNYKAAYKNIFLTFKINISVKNDPQYWKKCFCFENKSWFYYPGVDPISPFCSHKKGVWVCDDCIKKKIVGGQVLTGPSFFGFLLIFASKSLSESFSCWALKIEAKLYTKFSSSS